MNDEYILYLDLDGVLVDWAEGYRQATKGIYSREKAKEHYRSMGKEFWVNLPWEHGGKELWEASKVLFKRVYILSSGSTRDDVRAKMVEEGKREWLSKNIPDMPQSNVYIVHGKEEKIPYAAKDAILVDDKPITIERWNKEGGYGILHNSKHYKNTIETLKEIASPLNLSEIVKRFKR